MKYKKLLKFEIYKKNYEIWKYKKKSRFIKKKRKANINGIWCSVCHFTYSLAKFLGSDSLRCSRVFLLVQTEEAISISYGRRTNSWKAWRWMKLDLIFTKGDIYINSSLDPLTNFSNRSRNTQFNVILSRIISQMIPKTTPVSTRVVISIVMIRGILFWAWRLKHQHYQNF